VCKKLCREPIMISAATFNIMILSIRLEDFI